MENSEHPQSISSRIEQQISAGQVHMKSRRYFLLRALLLGLGTTTVALVLLYLVSFGSFALHASGAWFAPRAGWRGVAVLLGSLPWLIVALAAGFVVLLEVLVRRYAVAYRWPMLYSAVGVVALVTIGSSIVAHSSLHRVLLRNAQEGHLPFAGQIYREFGAPRMHNVHRGVVSSMTSDGFLLATPRDELLAITTSSPAQVRVNDSVLVLGERSDDHVAAWDVRVVPDDMPIFPPRGPGNERFPRPLPY